MFKKVKNISWILPSFILLACSLSPINPQKETQETTTPLVLKKEVQENPNSYRIQKQAAKPFNPSDANQLINFDKDSLKKGIPSDVNRFESQSPEIIKKLKDVLKSAKTSPVSIVHFGDSHVQLGYAQQITRESLQDVFGRGGRGLIFPYAIAKTYSQNDYVSKFTGLWNYASSIQEYPKIPLGVGGFVAKTSDSNPSFTISFNSELPKKNNSIQLFYRLQSGSVPVTIHVNQYQYSDVLVPSKNKNIPNVLRINVQDIKDTIHLVFDNSQGDKNFLEIYGLNIESSENGITYHNAGVGGANYGAILAQSFFELQLESLKPSIVILDYGTNDILYTNQVPTNLETKINNTIAKVRSAQPNSIIIIMSPQDMFFKGRDISSAKELNQLLKKLALQNNCLFYDWYGISGGKDAMKPWVSYGIGRTDHIHLTNMGYALKGFLLAQAFENSINFVENMSTSLELKDYNSNSVVSWLKEQSTLKEGSGTKSNVVNSNTKTNQSKPLKQVTPQKKSQSKTTTNSSSTKKKNKP
jgi:lysophospholipase L1-like esterase